MRPRLRRLLSCLAVAFAAACAGGVTGGPARAQDERIQVDTSDREIAIESDFTGANVTVFGAVEHSRQDAANPNYYDIIIIIRGPTETVVAREKERIAGIWVNGRSASFSHVPSFYAALSNRPLDQIADPALLRRYGIEFNPKPQSGDGSGPDEFERAIIDAKKKEQLYVVEPRAVDFLGRSLFRGTVTLPAKVKVGAYSAEVYLLHDGKLLSQHNASLKVVKAGIERELTTLAYTRPWVYGLLSVAVAVACGLMGWTLFRRN
jgi:uncharacterized protein (TIGR02186 family)